MCAFVGQNYRNFIIMNGMENIKKKTKGAYG